MFHTTGPVASIGGFRMIPVQALRKGVADRGYDLRRRRSDALSAADHEGQVATVDTLAISNRVYGLLGQIWQRKDFPQDPEFTRGRVCWSYRVPLRCRQASVGA